MENQFTEHCTQANIKVVGVGGGGGNAVDLMVENVIEGVEFIAVNTDAQALLRSKADVKIQIGTTVSKGLGAGADPTVGKEAAVEDIDSIRKAIEGANMIFIATGMGGGTGTGAAPEVARLAKELGILTVAVVTRPFFFEMQRRSDNADRGIEELTKYVDSLITIPNEKLLKVMPAGTALLDAFKQANDVLRGAVQGISELITNPGLINADFADVKAVMSEMGTAMMGSGRASGPDRAEEAAEAAIACPLLEDIDLEGARGILVNITAGPDLQLEEFRTVGDAVKVIAADSANVVIGTSIDMNMSDEIRVTVVATGMGGKRKPDISLVANESSKVAEPLREQATGTTDFVAQPTEAAPTNTQTTENNANAKGQEYLDIPAFLRRQAD